MKPQPRISSGTRSAILLPNEIERALIHAGDEGITRTAIRDLFGRNKSGDRIGAALALLATKGRARSDSRVTGGRPSEIWFAVGGRGHG